MLSPDENLFPNNVVKYVHLAMDQIDPDVPTFKRSLRPNDPQQCIGTFAQAWDPDAESLEMQSLGQGTAPQLPTLSRYTFGLQSFVKDSEQARGLGAHNALSQATRLVLYTNPNLQIVLGQLSSDLGNGFKESTRRWGVRTVRFFSGEIRAQMLYLSTLEFWVETETRRTN